LPQAYAWLSIAVENGAKPTGRDIVAQQLTSAQLAEAMSRWRNCARSSSPEMASVAARLRRA